MHHSAARLLYWTPRILAIAYTGFICIFALDVFSENHGSWPAVLAFTIHLIPAMVVVAMLLVAWRWEWIGAALFSFAAAAYAWMVLPRHLDWAAGIAGPLLVIGALFLVNWLQRSKLHAPL